ncbi:MAG: tail fiber domain-containing protein [Bacteroidota bacterium]
MRILLLATLSILIALQASAQNVGINSAGVKGDASAMLDVSSDSLGLLVPRMSLQKRNLIKNPSNGLLVFQNTGVTGFYYYDQPTTQWKPAGDNLGNHTMTSNMVTGSSFFSRNGNSSGLQFPDEYGSVRFRGNPNEGSLLVAADRFRIDNNGGFVALSSSLGYGVIPATGPGLRLMWSTNKGAFRAGEATTDQMDDANIGYYSWAGGYNAVASGYTSFAQGDGSNATGPYSVALGAKNTSSGSFSFSAGLRNVANSYASTVVGKFNDTIAASATQSFLTDPIFSVGIGTADNARKNAITILKNGKMGIGVLSPAYILDVNGRPLLRHSAEGSAGIWYNNSLNTSGIFAGMKTNTQWGVYGTDWQFYFDISNGEAYKSSGSSAWIVASDARLKEDVQPYTDGLNEVLNIDPVWFKYKENSGFNSSKAYPGIVAQDLKEVAPYMVGKFEKNGEEYLNVDNSAMTYMLINSIKELKSEIETLKKEVKTLRDGK